jgi:hypothetical protein
MLYVLSGNLVCCNLQRRCSGPATCAAIHGGSGVCVVRLCVLLVFATDQERTKVLCACIVCLASLVLAGLCGFFLPRIGFTDAAPPLNVLVIDGCQLPIVPLSSGKHYCKLGSSLWSICFNDDFLLSERSVANSGPGTQITYSGPVVAVYGTQGDTATTAALQSVALNVANNLFAQIKLSVTLVSDAEFSWSMLSNASMLLFGGPALNSVSSGILAGTEDVDSGCNISSTLSKTLQFSQGDGSVTLGQQSYGGDGWGIAAFGIINETCPSVSGKPEYVRPFTASASGSPTPFVRVSGQSPVLLFGGETWQGIATAAKQADLGESTSVLPDFIVTSQRCSYQGVGGLLAAGFWGNKWEWRADLSYSSSPVDLED